MSDQVLTDAELAAAEVGWRLAHNEICRLQDLCSMHQPIGAQAQRGRLVDALLSDRQFMALKDRADWLVSMNRGNSAEDYRAFIREQVERIETRMPIGDDEA